jgi:hypothetical protein
MSGWGQAAGGLMQIILRIFKLAKGSPTKDIEKEKKDLREKSDKFKETGRPTW